MMNEIKLCSYCKFANPLSATVCQRCGTPLVPLLTARLTPTVPNLNSQPGLPHHEHFEQLVTADTLLFVIAGTETSISIKKSKTVLLAREASGNDMPQIDLNPYNAFLLGVSRQHAAIELSGTSYYIRDLESTNGTWLNDRKLIAHDAYQLLSGDFIRLGQLGLYVYFEMPKLAAYDCVITDIVGTITFTPEYLTMKLGPYLILLSELNSVIDTLMEHTQFLVTLQAISIEPDANQIRVQCLLNDTLLLFLENNVVEWKKDYYTTIRKIWELEQAPIRLNLGSQEDPISPGYKEVRDQIQAPLTELVKHFLDHVAPDLADAEATVYLNKLTPLIYRLVHSSLQMKRDPMPQMRT
ncbi:MAG: FHA domain-containing protein [Chloroflexota bacterium]